MKKIILICLMGLMVTVVWASVTGTTPVVNYKGTMPGGLNLTTGVTESDVDIPVWDEQQDVTLTADLAVDIIDPGSYARGGDSPTPGAIPSGTTVSSYIVHFDEDPVAGGPGAITLSGSITFDEPILGLIMLTDSLVASDGIVGIATTTYDPGTGSPGNVRGLETFDSNYSVQDPFTLSGDRLTLSFVLKTAGGADEMRIIVEGGPLEVVIDIKPGSYPNSINPNAGGVIPVAILTTADFDASTVDPETVALDGAGARGKGKSGKYGSMEDVDGDGDLDLVVQIENVITWAPDATEATLTGKTYDGIAIQGTDTVNIVPPG